MTETTKIPGPRKGWINDKIEKGVQERLAALGITDQTDRDAVASHFMGGNEEEQEEGPKPFQLYQQQQIPQQAFVKNALKLFLVVGSVSMRPVQGSVIFSEQTRIIWASNDEEAVGKFIKYFTDMSDANGTYVVNGVSISEAID